MTTCSKQEKTAWPPFFESSRDRWNQNKLLHVCKAWVARGPGSGTKRWLGGGNSNIFYFHPYLGKIAILTNIFQMGWNHQLVKLYDKLCQDDFTFQTYKVSMGTFFLFTYMNDHEWLVF